MESPKQTVAVLGLGYVGLFDELSLFNRALAPEEIRLVFQSERPVPAAFGHQAE